MKEKIKKFLNLNWGDKSNLRKTEVNTKTTKEEFWEFIGRCLRVHNGMSRDDIFRHERTAPYGIIFEDKIILSEEREKYYDYWVGPITEVAQSLCDLYNEKWAPLEYFNAFVPEGVDKLYGRFLIRTFLKETEKLTNEKKALLIGSAGEEKVIETLNAYGDRYNFISNLVLSSTWDCEQTAEMDIVLITEKALFAIEIKNRGAGNQNREIRVMKDGLWQIKVNGDWTNWESPVEQNIRHKIFIEENLKKYLNRDKLGFDIVPVIVFANDDVKIENHSNNIVIRVSELINFIETYSGKETITSEEKTNIIELLKKNNGNGRKMVKVKDYEDIYQRGKKLYNVMEEVLMECALLNEEYLRRFRGWRLYGNGVYYDPYYVNGKVPSKSLV